MIQPTVLSAFAFRYRTLSFCVPFGVALLGILNAGCNQESDASKTQDQTASGDSPGKALFVARCGMCHGDSGKGDGPASAGLSPKPRDFTDPAWQQKTSADHIRKAILEGGAAVGLSPAMPGAPDLKDKPQDLDALVRYVKSL